MDARIERPVWALWRMCRCTIHAVPDLVFRQAQKNAASALRGMYQESDARASLGPQLVPGSAGEYLAPTARGRAAVTLGHLRLMTRLVHADVRALAKVTA